MTQTKEPPDPADLELLNKVADQIVRRGLTVPAVFFLESSKPMSYIGSQALVFLEPFVRAFLTFESYNRFVRLLEDRENYETLIQTIESRDAEYEAERRAAKIAREKLDERAGGDQAGGQSRRDWRRWFGRRSR